MNRERGQYVLGGRLVGGVKSRLRARLAQVNGDILRNGVDASSASLYLYRGSV
jgi:hypothetical protein